MKLFTGWMISALVLTTAAANGQGLAPHEIGPSPYTVVSDVIGPYAAMPPEAQEPGYAEPRYSEPRYVEPGYGVPRYEPALLPPTEVYAIVRESGFSPLGIPRQRGLFYVISVIDRRGDDGRLVIDAHSGRIVRFTPAYRMGDNFGDPAGSYGPVGPLPPISNMRGVPRPPVSIPRVASRTPVPLPKAPPPRAGDVKPEAQPLAARPAAEKSASDKPASDKPASEPAQQTATAQAKPVDTPTKPPAAVPIVEAKPTPEIQPTQAMPKALGLD